MRNAAFSLLAASAAASLLAAPVTDAAKHSVTFTATATGMKTSDKIEFLFVGPDSDNDYEALFVTDDTIADLVSAIERAGIPRGRDFDGKLCRLWPAGEFISFEPSITNIIRDVDGTPLPSVVFSGGRRDPSGVPEAHTNSPCAFLALYNCPQSILQMDESLPQSPTYGRFAPTTDFTKGEKRTFTISWNGAVSVRKYDLKIEPGKFTDALKALKDASAQSELDVLADFSSDLTLKDAVVSATALGMLDSARVKMNGFKEGQFYFRAYLPMEKWRDRKERLAQPPEIHLSADGKISVFEIIEDWSDESSLDPKLTVREHPASSPQEAASIARPIAEKTYTAFVYAPAEMQLGKLHEIKKLMNSDLIWNWYVFTEEPIQKE